jgi:DNA-binding response OmpR family regulator
VINLRSIRLLVVEDNLDDLRILRRALTQHELLSIEHVARDGQEALDYLFRNQGDAAEKDTAVPDMILLDINLPRLNGIEVLRRLRSHDALAMVPVIMFTSSAREEDIVSSYRFGSNTYIQKPMEFAELMSLLIKLEDYWTGLAKLPPARLVA